MMIYKIIGYTIVLAAIAYGFSLNWDDGYNKGYEAHKLEAQRSPKVEAYADLKYVTATYKRLYEECAGDNVVQNKAIEQLLLNLELGEL